MEEQKVILRYRIKDILKSKGRTIKWLAGEIGVLENNLSSGLHCKYNLSLSTLVDIARVLEVEFSDLFAKTHWCEPVDSDESYTESINVALARYDLTIRDMRINGVLNIRDIKEMVAGRKPMPEKICIKLQRKLFLDRSFFEKYFVIE